MINSVGWDVKLYSFNPFIYAAKFSPEQSASCDFIEKRFVKMFSAVPVRRPTGRRWWRRRCC